ncbi:hypothetical protein ND980_05565 [Vibrio diabolicus]|uniref:DNA sulfur modification protein DndB n=2 Tax=Vibrio diabolicus TaxID=50719 RepID=UPI00215F033E|nr:DNA sulfur modification protein DndB [Vibrio diabolicus]MCS0391719.1 hypothetical protein [Vibrio diabolicus]
MKSFGNKDLFTLSRTGSFGRFTAAGSFPVDFVLTSFDTDDLEHLTFARQLTTDKLDFEMMMQRDIDEGRARKELAEYLYPSKKNIEELKSNVVFFPPILVAILDVRNNKVSPYYPDYKEFEDKDGFLNSQWGDCFKLKAFLTDEGQECNEYGGKYIQKTPVELSLNMRKNGARLVVIDGQHRLFAIKEMLETDKAEALKNLHLPICIVYPPRSVEGEDKVPSVTEVFRHLFVDVNSTMEQVGGHFTILLKDNNLSSISIRKLCDSIVSEDLGQEYISAVEWNTKSKKESTNLTKKYSITSIGIIDKALSETIAKSQKVLRHIFDVEEDIEWDNFDLSKKNEFETHVEEKLIPLISKMFFEINIFKDAFTLHSNKIDEIKRLTNGENGSKYKVVYNTIINSSPLPSNCDPLVEDIFQDFSNQVSSERKKSNCRLINYALFQRSIFYIWYVLLGKLKSYYSAEQITDLTVDIINLALDEERDIFGLSRRYLQYSIWQDGNIKRGEKTRIQFSRLIFSILSSLDIRQILADRNLEHEDIEDIEDCLKELSEKSIMDYFSDYKEQRIKSFRVEYPRYIHLNDEEIEELTNAQREQDKLIEKIKMNKIDKSQMRYPFDELVNEYITDELEITQSEMKQVIRFDFNFVS